MIGRFGDVEESEDRRIDGGVSEFADEGVGQGSILNRADGIRRAARKVSIAHDGNAHRDDAADSSMFATSSGRSTWQS
jgi:hypothetical protein